MRDVCLEEVAQLTVGHVGSMVDEYVDAGIPFLRSLNIQPHRIDFQETKFITRDFHKKLRKSSLRPNDVVIVRTGKPGTCAVIPEDLVEANCSDLVIVRCGPHIRPRFLAYWVNAAAGEHVASHIVGAVQQHFNVGSAKRMPIRLPSLQDQDQVLAILGTLDDKIQLNRKTAATLEEMARALYRSWFVDFDPVRARAEGRAPAHMDPTVAALFPQNFSEDGLPVGWVKAPLRALCKITSGKRPPRKVTAASSRDPIPVYGGNGISWFTNEKLFDARFLVTGRVGTLGTIFRVYEQCWVSDNALCILPLSDASLEYIFFAASEIDFSSLNSGSTQPLLTRTILGGQELIVPNEPVMSAFHDQTSAWFGLQNNLNAQNRTLATLRDTLLPRLMSGELRVGAAREMIEEVA